MNPKQREEERRHRGLDTHRISWLPRKGGRARETEAKRQRHACEQEKSIQYGSTRAGKWGRRGSKKEKANTLYNDGVHRAERKWKGTTWGVREEDTTQEKKGVCLKGRARARYIEHAVEKWRGCIFACDILLRYGTQSKTGHYANVRRLRQYNHYLSHFTCSAY